VFLYNGGIGICISREPPHSPEMCCVATFQSDIFLAPKTMERTWVRIGQGRHHVLISLIFPE
jgi:hypothetical protein